MLSEKIVKEIIAADMTYSITDSTIRMSYEALNEDLKWMEEQMAAATGIEAYTIGQAFLRMKLYTVAVKWLGHAAGLGYYTTINPLKDIGVNIPNDIPEENLQTLLGYLLPKKGGE